MQHVNMGFDSNKTLKVVRNIVKKSISTSPSNKIHQHREIVIEEAEERGRGVR